jgi:hypothetical protein
MNSPRLTILRRLGLRRNIVATHYCAFGYQRDSLPPLRIKNWVNSSGNFIRKYIFGELLEAHKINTYSQISMSECKDDQNETLRFLTDGVIGDELVWIVSFTIARIRHKITGVKADYKLFDITVNFDLNKYSWIHSSWFFAILRPSKIIKIRTRAHANHCYLRRDNELY